MVKPFIFIIILTLLNTYIHAQKFDSIFTRSGDTVLCVITNELEDRYELDILADKRWVESNIYKQKVERIKFYILEDLKEDFDTTKNYRFEIKDGGPVFYGRIVKIGQRKITVVTESIGKVVLDVLKIDDYGLAEIIVKKGGAVWFDNPHDTRYLFAPTARNLKKGEGYFQDIYIFFVNLNIGLTDHISIGGGSSIIPGIEISEQLFFLNPKVGFEVGEDLNLGGGFLLLSLSDMGNYSIFYGVSTYGNANSNATLGLGYGLEDGDLTRSPFLMIAGMHRISRRISLLSENWMIPGEEGVVVSYGFRFFGEKISADLAFVNLLGTGEALFPGIPYVDFVIKF